MTTATTNTPLSEHPRHGFNDFAAVRMSLNYPRFGCNTGVISGTLLPDDRGRRLSHRRLLPLRHRVEADEDPSLYYSVADEELVRARLLWVGE